MVEFAWSHLHEGRMAITWRDTIFNYSYFLWFEDISVWYQINTSHKSRPTTWVHSVERHLFNSRKSLSRSTYVMVKMRRFQRIGYIWNVKRLDIFCLLSTCLSNRHNYSWYHYFFFLSTKKWRGTYSNF